MHYIKTGRNMTTEIVIAVIGVVSNLVTYVLTKRKYNAEVDSSVIGNLKESLDFYKKLSDDNKQRLDEILKRNDQLEDEVRDLRKQVLSLMGSICYNATCENRRLHEKIKSNKKGGKDEPTTGKKVEKS